MKVHFESHGCSPTLRWQTLELISSHYTLPPEGYNEKLETWRQRISAQYPGCEIHAPAYCHKYLYALVCTYYITRGSEFRTRFITKVELKVG